MLEVILKSFETLAWVSRLPPRMQTGAAFIGEPFGYPVLPLPEMRTCLLPSRSSF